jgi:hypothetical protein
MHLNAVAEIARALVLLVALCVAGVACGGGGSDGRDPDYTARGGNLLQNPGFEEGVEPWFSLETDERSFTTSTDFAHSGETSAHLHMDDGAGATGTKVYYLVQELTPETLPEAVEGFYRVENWESGTPKQYLQFVVIAAEPKNFGTEFNNYQLRYIIAGIDLPPFVLPNAKFLFLNTDDPDEGRWTHFGANIAEDFEREWGMRPEGFAKLRVLFEVRWDDRAAGQPASRADVYYDDLFVGPGE